MLTVAKLILRRIWPSAVLKPSSSQTPDNVLLLYVQAMYGTMTSTLPGRMPSTMNRPSQYICNLDVALVKGRAAGVDFGRAVDLCPHDRALWVGVEQGSEDGFYLRATLAPAC
jgi:hypothetical protein